MVHIIATHLQLLGIGENRTFIPSRDDTDMTTAIAYPTRMVSGVIAWPVRQHRRVELHDVRQQFAKRAGAMREQPLAFLG